MENKSAEHIGTIEKVLAEIRENRLTMRPKIYFILKVAILIAVAFSVFVVSIFLCGFVFWSIVASGDMTLLGFGTKGFLLFFVLFPWWLLLLDIALIAILETLLRRFRFCYQIPTLYLLLGLLVGTLSFGFLLENLTHFHEALGQQAEKHELPLLGGWYEDAKRPIRSSDICRCVVVGVGTSTLLVQEEWNIGTTTKSRTVILQNPSDASNWKIGDRIYIFGTESAGGIRPHGVVKLPLLATTSAASTL